MKWICVLSVLLLVVSVTTAATKKVTSKQQEDAVSNLRKAFSAKPESLTDGAAYKSVLTKWIEETDQQVLRSLISRIQYPCKRRFSLTKLRKSKPKSPGPKATAYEDRLPPQIIHRRLLAMSQEESGAQLKVFLAAMTTPDGQKALQPLNIKQSVIDDLVKQMNGDKDQQNKAKQTFKTIIQSVTKNEMTKLRPVYVVYVRFDLQQKTSQAVKTATPEQLNNLLTVLINAEKRYKFDGISFSSVKEQVNKSSKGQAEAVDTLTKWIEKTDIKNMRRLNHYVIQIQRAGVTLEQVKSTISKKIEGKTSAQLIEFLNVLETTEGKTLLGKLSVKPSSSVPDLITKLKSGNKADETAVKKILQEWVNKMTVNDMKEFQNSKQIFIQYRARQAAISEVQKADEKTLLNILTLLASKESTGTKFEGINFTDLKAKLTKDGAKSMDEIKKTITDWIAKVKYEQLGSLKDNKAGSATKVNVQGSNSKFTVQTFQNPFRNPGRGNVAASTTQKPSQAPTSSSTTAKSSAVQPKLSPPGPTTTKPTPGFNSTSTTTAKPTTIKSAQQPVNTTTVKPTTTRKPRRFFGFKLNKKTKPAVQKTSPAGPTLTTLTDIKTAALFQQFILKQKSKVSVTNDNVKKAVAQIIVYGSNDDIKTVFGAASKGSSGHVAKMIQEGLFKVQVSTSNGRIQKTSSENDWKTLRKDLENWVNKWTQSKSSLFSIWYKRGVQAKK